jgi:ABC-type sugar transport system ATPase subunit
MPSVMLAHAGHPAPLFDVHGITKVYHMGEVEVHALGGIDLEVRTGEFVVLLGASGSGKSTLLNILGGLDAPTTGQVRFEDRDLSRAGEAELTLYRHRHVGFVFQFYNLIPSLTARENVALETEMSVLLLGELAIEIALAIPIGYVLGFLLAALMLALMQDEVFKILLIILPSTYLFAGAAVAAASVLSALVVRHRIDRLDMVAVLKTRE